MSSSNFGSWPVPVIDARLTSDGHPDLLVAVLAACAASSMKIHERAHQPRAARAEDDEPRAADLGAALEVDDAERVADLPVRLAESGAVARRAPRPRRWRCLPRRPRERRASVMFGSSSRMRCELCLGAASSSSSRAISSPRRATAATGHRRFTGALLLRDLLGDANCGRPSAPRPPGSSRVASDRETRARSMAGESVEGLRAGACRRGARRCARGPSCKSCIAQSLG